MGLTDDDIKKLQEQQSHATAVAEKSHVEAMAKQNSVIGEFNRAHADAVRGDLRLADRLEAQRAALDRGFQASNAQLGIIARKGPDNLAVTVTVNTAVSIDSVQRRVTSDQISVGHGPLESF